MEYKQQEPTEAKVSKKGLTTGMPHNSQIEEKPGDTGSGNCEATLESRKQKPSDSFSRAGLWD